MRSISAEARCTDDVITREGGPDKLYGLAVWDADAEVFKPTAGGNGHKMRYSGAQAVQITKPESEDAEYIYYASAFAMSRVRAHWKAVEDPAAYEYYTPCNPIEQGGCGVKMSRSSWGWKQSSLNSSGVSGVGYFGPV